LRPTGSTSKVIDPRTLVPLDKRAILDSVARTGRLVVADETRLNCGVASEISAIVAEEGFGSLKAPILRVARPNAPVSAAPTHEKFVMPSAEKIAAAVKKVMRNGDA
jgi:pyruvate dehydrogenase E1 component beta subunit